MPGETTSRTGKGPVVCHLIEALGYGGAETLVHRLATGARGLGYQPLVLSLRGGPLRALLESDGIAVECLDLPRPGLGRAPSFIAFLWRAVFAMCRILRERRVDIVHAHLPDAILLGAPVAMLCRARFVATYHGLGILPAGRGRYDPRNRLRRLLYRFAERLSDRTIAVSVPVRDMLFRELGFSRETTVLVMNGIDTEELGRARDVSHLRSELCLSGSQRIVTCVGRLAINKGQQFLVQAMADLTAEFPEVVLVLVGSGPLADELRSSAVKLGVESSVRFLGERSDVPEILALSEVFVLPSFAEGIPLALLEAMAAGVPVVATRVPGSSDVVEDDRSGLLVPSRDAGALSRAIGRLLRDRRLARGLACRAREHVQQNFDISRTLLETAELYHDILSSSAVAARPHGCP